MNRGSLHSHHLLYHEALCGVPGTLPHHQPVPESLPNNLMLPASAWNPLQEWFLLRAEIPLDIQLLVLLQPVLEGAAHLQPRVG